MIAAWMGYTTLLGVCVALAAAALEPLVAGRGAGRRFPWIIAVLLAVLVPAGVAVRPDVEEPVRAVRADLPVVRGAAGVAAAAVAPWSVDRGLLFAWSGASFLMFAAIGASAWRLHVAGRRARRALLDGEPVALTDDVGPGARGFGTPRILVPAWMVALEPSRRALLVRHEREHLRTGDPWVVLGALGALAVLPWNLPLWFMVRRLRVALELDCDARVLARGSDVAAYGELLLTVAAARRPALFSAYLSFASHPSALERRIRAMTSPTTPLGPFRQAGLALVALVAVVAACETRRPEPLAPVSSYTIRDGQASPAQVPSGAAADSARASLAQLLRERIPPEALTGDPNDPLLLVFDASGGLVAARRLDREPGAAGGALAGLDYAPESIERVEVNKGAATLPPEARGGIIHVVLKPGAQPGAGGASALRLRAAERDTSRAVRLRGAEPTTVVIRDSQGRELHREVLAMDAANPGASGLDRTPVDVADIASVEVTKADGPSGGVQGGTVVITLKPGKALRPRR